jgi:hypothetical protein
MPPSLKVAKNKTIGKKSRKSFMRVLLFLRHEV